MKLDSINIGNIGESAFQNLCQMFGIIVNKSLIEDRRGWDFLIEYDKKILTNTPLDKINNSIECKFQIKTTITEIKSINVKLINLKRLIDYSNPAFILVIFLSENKSIQKLYLIHIDKKVIEKVFKRLRIINHKNETLKNQKLSIKLLNEYEINIIGDEIKNKINELTKYGIEQYVREKQEIKKIIGNLFYIGKFDINEMNPFEAMADHLLGLKKEIKIKHFQTFEQRFNIKSNNPVINVENGFIQVDNKPFKSNLIIKNNEFDTGVFIEVDTYTTNWAYNNLPPNLHAIRLKYENNDIIIKENIITFSFNDFDFNKPISFSLLFNHYKLLDCLNKKNDIIIEVEPKNNFPKIIVEGKFQNFNIDISKDFERIKTLKSIIDLSDFSYDIKLYFIDFISQFDKIDAFKFISSKKDMKLHFSNNKILSEINELLYIPYIFNIKLYETEIVFSISITSNFINNKKDELINELKLTNFNYNIIKKYIINKNQIKNIKIENCLNDIWEDFKNYKNATLLPINEFYEEFFNKLNNKI